MRGVSATLAGAGVSSLLAGTRGGMRGVVCHPTAVCWKDVIKRDRGESRRLTYEERSERRMGKTKEQKASKEQLVQEAQTMVNEDFPDELEGIFTRVAERANVSAMKVLNMAKCLELLDVEVSGGHSVMLIKVAEVVKTGPHTIEISAKNTIFASPILQRISRFDSTLQVSKDGPKIKVSLPTLTTAQRDKTASDIAGLVHTFRQRVKQSRTNAGRTLQDCGLDDGALNELLAAMDLTVSSFVEEKTAELELLAEEVMSMGIDESDAAVA